MAGIYEPQIKKFEDGVQAIRDSVPDFSGVTSAVSAPSPAARPRPTVGASAAAPAPGLAASAAGAGAQVRRAAGAAVGAAGNFAAGGALRLGATADAVSAPVRAGVDARDNFVRGFAGLAPRPSSPAPFTQAAGQMVQGARAAIAPRPRANFSDVTSTVTQTPDRSNVIVGDGRAGSPTNPYVKPDASAAPGLAQATSNATPAFNLKPGDVNTFTGSNGITRAVPGLQASPAGPTSSAPVAPMLAPRPVVSAQPAPSYAARGRQGGIIANPANGSVADQITRAMGSPSLKGSPSARAAVAQAIMQQAGFENGERQSALETGDKADLGALENQATANEGFRTRDLAAQTANATLQDNEANRQNAVTTARIARRPSPTTLADGTLGEIQDDGSFRSVTGADGNPVKGQQFARQTGELTQGERLKALTEMRTAAAGFAAPEEGTPERKSYDERLAELDGQIEGVMSGQAAGGGGNSQNGMTQVGTTPQGKPVYRDAAGNQFVDE